MMSWKVTVLPTEYQNLFLMCMVLEKLHVNPENSSLFKSSLRVIVLCRISNADLIWSCSVQKDKSGADFFLFQTYNITELRRSIKASKKTTPECY